MLKPSAEADAFSRRLITLLESGDSASVAAELDPGLTSYSAWQEMAIVRDTVRSVHRDSTTLVGWSEFTTARSSKAYMTYELVGKGRELITISIERREHKLAALDIHLRSIDPTVVAANDFHFGGKSLVHYFVFFTAILCALFCFGSAIVVARTPMPKRWLWAFVALIGAGEFMLDWSTGQTAFVTGKLMLFGAQFLREGEWAPWVISFSLPVGAAYSLWRRRQFLTAPPPPAVEVTTARCAQ